MALFVTGGSAQATTWNLADNFNTASNPDGNWTFGWEQSLNGALNLYDTTNNNVQWYSSTHHSGDNTPTIWINNGTAFNYGVAPGQVSLHPGWDGSLSVARWTSTVNGTIDINGIFGAGDFGAMSYYISQDATSTILSSFANPVSDTFQYALNVSVGDTLDFMVGTGNGGYGYGNTPLDVTITSSQTNTSAPEPATLALLGMGFAGLGVIRRRKAA